jgi:surface carbohydrate biosynthesis protein (TIGR04326 family)
VDQADQLIDGATLFVWDADGMPPIGNWIVVLWRSLQADVSLGAVSIPLLVERNSDSLRASYLAWIYELGERKVHGQSLADYLQVRPGFSFWWMSLLAEKCSYSKSPQIADAIRFMALVQWVGGHSPAKVVLVSANRALVKCVRLWCAGLGLAFEWRQMSVKPVKMPWIRRIYELLPHPLRALIWLARHLHQSWPLRRVGLSEWRASKGRVTFMSYLFNLSPDSLKSGRFESSYWAHLPKELLREGIGTNWLHWYVKDSLLPCERLAAKALRQFNVAAGGEQVHVTLNTFLEVRVVIKTLSDAGRMAWKVRLIPGKFFEPSHKGVNLWPLFEEEWRESSFGLAAINNALALSLLESALQLLPKQCAGIYLQENQGWEFAFVHAWKSAGHGQLIGVPHSTVRYWDLRYFFDRRSYDRSGIAALPMPDLVALNGKAARESYSRGNYPMDKTRDVEALRYLHLEKISVKADEIHQPGNPFMKILVLGDYLSRNTHLQMSLLEEAMLRLPGNVIVTVKPHPACPIQSENYPMLRMDLTKEPISQLLTGCSVAYTSAGTSAAADVYCAGVPVVSVFDPNTLNQSPLRDRNDVFFVSNAEGLASALLVAMTTTRPDSRSQDFFQLDSRLPRWRALLKSTLA